MLDGMKGKPFMAKVLTDFGFVMAASLILGIGIGLWLQR